MMPNMLMGFLGTLGRNKKKHVAKVKLEFEKTKDIAAFAQEKTVASLSGLKAIIINMLWEFIIKAANKRALDELPDNIMFHLIFSESKTPDVKSVMSLQALKERINNLSVSHFKGLLNYLNNLPEGSLPQIKQEQYCVVAGHLEKLVQNLFQKLALNQNDDCCDNTGSEPYYHTILDSQCGESKSSLSVSGNSGFVDGSNKINEDNAGYLIPNDEHDYEEISEGDHHYEEIPGQKENVTTTSKFEHSNSYNFFFRINANADNSVNSDYVTMEGSKQQIVEEEKYVPMAARK